MRILTLGLVFLSLGLFEAADPDLEDRFNKLEQQMRTLTRTVEDLVRILQQNNNQKVQENTGKAQPQIVEQIETKYAENNNEVTNEENRRKGDKSRSKRSINHAISEETADAAIFGEIDNLELSDIGLDSRLDSLEVNGTVAFFVTLGLYTSIQEDSVVLFQEVQLNNGNGYNSLTGEFTVPPGGGGLYYFEAYFLINYDGEGVFQIRMNGAAVCLIRGVFILSTDRSTSSCGTTAQLQEGDIVDVFYNGGTDDTPVFEDGNKQNGFTGYRVAPQ